VKRVIFCEKYKLIMLMLIIVLMAGCGSITNIGRQQGISGEDLKDKPKIRIAHNWGSETKFYMEFKDRFEAFAQDNKELASYSLESERGDSLRDKIKIDMASNNLPDIFYYWAITSLKPMYEENLILDVNKYFEISKTVKAEDFVRYALDAYSPDGEKIYAVPLVGSLDYFACNRELFKKYNLKYPETYDDLLAVSKVFLANGITPLAVGSKGGNPSHFLFAEVYYQYGSLDYMRKVTTGENRFDYELNRKTAEIILEMAENGLFPEDPIAYGYFAPSVSLYNNEQAAMILAQTWSIKYFSAEIAEKTDLITFPRFEDAVNDPAEFTVGGVNNGWVINRTSFEDPDKKMAVTAAMDFLVSDEVMMMLAKNGDFIMKNTEIDPSVLSPLYNKVLSFTQKQKPLTNFWILMPNPTSQEVLSISMDELWTRTIGAEEFCKKIQSAIDKATQK